jgi:hypothetical protein
MVSKIIRSTGCKLYVALCRALAKGSQAHQLLATLYVASSLALFAWGGADLAGKFCLRTLIYCRRTTIVRPILDAVAISHDVVGMSCEELEWPINMCLLRL